MPVITPNSIRLALVEDNAGFRRGLKALFDLTPGLECVGIYLRGEEALREMPKVRPEVVLMDVNLPGLSGVECTRQLKAALPQVQVLMLTIEEDCNRVFAALRAGAAGYLLKTSLPAEIVEGIQLVARGGSPMSASIARRVVESFHGEKEPAAKRASLSQREVEVLESLARGHRIKEVAAELGISPTTVQTFLRRIYEKLQARSQAEAIAKFLS
jgi:DNA-binding NarL/FixJ family response regulator